MLSFLEVETGFIEMAKLPFQDEYKDWVTLPNLVQIRMLDVGVLQVKPSQTSAQATVISCGVHGNETAPIEIVSKQISSIVKGILQPTINLLYILGNPESMKVSKRFIAVNMNRLFAGGVKKEVLTDLNRYELTRAEKLESLVSEFYAAFPGGKKMHLDLHTAIKPSFHKTFAIRPFNLNPVADTSRNLLQALGIEALLQHNKPSTTFSYYTSNEFNAEAYTLELGKVKPFGENIPDDFVAAINCLDALVEARNLTWSSKHELVEYKVVSEIIKHSDDFKFYVKDDVANFTAFPQGYLIAEDFDYNYRVAYESEAVIFPNMNVPIGQRVAVMVTRTDE